jgi:hypothetical protein
MVLDVWSKTLKMASSKNVDKIWKIINNCAPKKIVALAIFAFISF